MIAGQLRAVVDAELRAIPLLGSGLAFADRIRDHISRPLIVLAGVRPPFTLPPRVNAVLFGIAARPTDHCEREMTLEIPAELFREGPWNRGFRVDVPMASRPWPCD